MEFVVIDDSVTITMFSAVAPTKVAGALLRRHAATDLCGINLFYTWTAKVDHGANRYALHAKYDEATYIYCDGEISGTTSDPTTLRYYQVSGIDPIVAMTALALAPHKAYTHMFVNDGLALAGLKSPSWLELTAFCKEMKLWNSRVERPDHDRWKHILTRGHDLYDPRWHVMPIAELGTGTWRIDGITAIHDPRFGAYRPALYAALNSQQ